MISFQYSADFSHLIKDPEKVKKLIEGSFVKGVDFEGWTKMRSLIAQSINKDGTILDIGCANGFLLRCLQEWSGYKLIPYGIDPDQKRIADAKKVFDQPDHFIEASIRELDDLESKGLPDQYDFVYWNVWDDKDFQNQQEIDWLERSLRRVKVGSRLILGLYNADKEKNRVRVENLKKLGYKITGVVENDYHTNEIIVWIDKLAS